MSEQADIEAALARATAAYKLVSAERDALKDATDRAEAAEAENERLREALAGWQLVPIIPTVAMLKAAADEKNRIRRAHEDEAIGGDYWRAMLAAAPTNAALAKEAGK